MTFKRLGRILIAGPIATLVVAITFAVFTGSIPFAIIGYFYALFFGFFVGLPLFLVTQLRLRISIGLTTILGFITGAVPVAIISWPPDDYAFKSFKAMDGTYYSIDGVTTAAGWAYFAQSLLPLSLLGAVVGLVFYFILRGLGDPLTPTFGFCPHLPAANTTANIKPPQS